MQSGNLGIQATDEAINTKTNQQKPAIMGGSRKGGAAKAQHTQHHKPHRRSEERSQEAAEDRERKDTHVPEGVRTCLSGVQKRGQGSYDDENLSEGAHSTSTTQEAWCRGKDPHTGPRAFVAMRHNEEGRQCATNTLCTEAGNQAVAGSNDTQREGPVKPGPRRQRGPSEGEGGPRQAGNRQQKQNQKTRHQHLM